MHQPETSLRETLITDGLIRSRDARMTPLSGGVSSEIYLVVDGDREFVVKRALPKLKVEQDWFADTSRNRFEWAFMQYVHRFRPDAMPDLLTANEQHGYFCMEYLGGFANWKQELLQGTFDVAIAGRAGGLLGEIHAHSWGDPEAQQAFQTTANFEQLRIEPYLRATASGHSAVRDTILCEADRLSAARQCLVHGDFSPKNLLRLDERIVALDCEVAWYGDPGFDLAFLLNHLFLKSLYHAPRRTPLDEMIMATINSYRKENVHAAEVEASAARLLPILMLARVDGKSPVEYLESPDKQSFLRDFTLDHLRNPATRSLGGLQKSWFEQLNELTE